MNLIELEKQFHQNEKDNFLDEEKLSFFCDDIRILLTFDYEKPNYKKSELEYQYSKTENELRLIFSELGLENQDEIRKAFFDSIGEIRRSLNTSIEAILEGDPASLSRQQIVLEYPGFEAILYYRVAHVFHKLNLPLIARFISERAHHHTGIDINPGARIGDYFFIDHGTGIVIGETAIIGNHVKLYQGVTLGALSLSKGRSLIGKKRHPTVEDNVTIYSNAAIFGGDTIIHKGSTIGGDVYLTHSVDANSVVLQTDKDLTIFRKNEEK